MLGCTSFPFTSRWAEPQTGAISVVSEIFLVVPVNLGPSSHAVTHDRTIMGTRTTRRQRTRPRGRDTHEASQPLYGDAKRSELKHSLSAASNIKTPETLLRYKQRIKTAGATAYKRVGFQRPGCSPASPSAHHHCRTAGGAPVGGAAFNLKELP
ncbi:hypothetical protein GN956_G12904 [Arapaima gigas]